MALQPLDASRVNPLEGGPSFSLGNRIMRALWNVTWAAWSAAFVIVIFSFASTA